jgi:hypothetical protein
VRDPRPQSAQERRAGRDRVLAGRRTGDRHLIETAARLAFAILFDAFAFTVWDVGTRGPVQLTRDVANGFRSLRTFAGGFVRFFTGIFAIAIGGLAVLPIVARMREPGVVEGLTLITGLVVEILVGVDLRRRLFARR